MVYIFGQLFGRQSRNFQGRKSYISTDFSFQHQSKVLLKRVLFFLVVLFEIILKYSAVLVGFRQVYSKCFLCHLQKGGEDDWWGADAVQTNVVNSLDGYLRQVIPVPKRLFKMSPFFRYTRYYKLTNLVWNGIIKMSICKTRYVIAIASCFFLPWPRCGWKERGKQETLIWMKIFHLNRTLQ